jgi:DNA polymerase-3 subunit epsilon
VDRRRGQGSNSTSRTHTDTLLFAKELHPGKKNSLDALCERYFVDNTRRTLHGALADARLPPALQGRRTR